MPLYTLDEIIDNQTAVLLLREDETQKTMLSVDQLPTSAKEGNILELTFNEIGKLETATIKREETEEALKKATSLLNKLRNK